MKIPKILKLSDVMLHSNMIDVADINSDWRQQTIATLAKEFDSQLTWAKGNAHHYYLHIPMVLRGQSIVEGKIGSIEWPKEINTKDWLDFLIGLLFNDTEWRFVNSTLESGLGAYPDNYFYIMQWRRN